MLEAYFVPRIRSLLQCRTQRVVMRFPWLAKALRVKLVLGGDSGERTDNLGVVDRIAQHTSSHKPRDSMVIRWS